MRNLGHVDSTRLPRSSGLPVRRRPHPYLVLPLPALPGGILSRALLGLSIVRHFLGLSPRSACTLRRRLPLALGAFPGNYHDFFAEVVEIPRDLLLPLVPFRTSIHPIPVDTAPFLDLSGNRATSPFPRYGRYYHLRNGSFMTTWWTTGSDSPEPIGSERSESGDSGSGRRDRRGRTNDSPCL